MDKKKLDWRYKIEKAAEYKYNIIKCHLWEIPISVNNAVKLINLRFFLLKLESLHN